MEKNMMMPDMPGLPPKEVQKENLINEISNIAQQMDVIWKFHPTNPKSVDLVEYYKTLQEWLSASQAAYKDLEG